MKTTDAGNRTHWLKIAAAAAWLLLVSVVTLILCIGATHQSEPTQERAPNPEVQALVRRVASLEDHFSAEKRRPAALTEAEFAAARLAMEQRIVRLEDGLKDFASATDLQSLQARFSDVESRWATSKSAIAARPRPPTTGTRPTPVPPFRILSTELRGGERFLTIASAGATSLEDTRLLREGDSDNGWLLQSIESNAAVFRVNGQSQRLAVP
jgi:hypothetical protein